VVPDDSREESNKWSSSGVGPRHCGVVKAASVVIVILLDRGMASF
jgi:hypothetical protein